MKKISFFILLLSTCSTITFGQNFNTTKFETLFQKGDFNEIQQFLNNWEKSSSSDVALYIAKIDFYYSFSLSVDSTKVIRVPNDAASIVKVKDTKGNVLLYKNLKEEINSELIGKAIQSANYGIANFPSRIDFREKKLVILNKMLDLDNIEKEIIRMFEDSKSQKWVDFENKEVIDIENTMLGYLNYVLELVEISSIVGYANLHQRYIKIWESYYKQFPNGGKSLSFKVGKIYFETGNYKKAYEQLSIANELLPKQRQIRNLLCETSIKLGGKYPYYVPEEYCR